MPVYLKTRANLGKKRKSRNANSIGIFGLFDRSTKFRKSAFLRTGLRFLVTRRVHFCTFSRPALRSAFLTAVALLAKAVDEGKVSVCCVLRSAKNCAKQNED